jgi:membrane-associated phospholipid phosphatase
MDALRQRLGSDFVPEWCAIGALALLDIALLCFSPVTFVVKPNDLVFLALGPCMMLALRAAGFGRGALIAEHISLMFLSSAAVCVLSYLCVAASGPLADPGLLAMDRALGFDWLANHLFVDAHPGLKRVLQFAYDSPFLQCIYFSILFGLMRDKDRLRGLFRLFFFGGLTACLGGLLLPALGPSKFFGHNAVFVPVIERLMGGHDLTFTLSGMTGVVSFPSFHTVAALVLIWGFRGTGIIGWFIAGLNLLVLCSVPYCGGHYLTDMIAGAGVAALSIAFINGAPVLGKYGIARREAAVAMPA